MTAERLAEIAKKLEPYEAEVWQDDDPGHPASVPYKVKQIVTPLGLKRSTALELLAEIERLRKITPCVCE